MIKKIKNNSGNIALILVVMITTLTLVSALALALINISDQVANYHLVENEKYLAERDSCLEDALQRINSNFYATGTYALNIGDIACQYQISETVAGAKTVTTTAASISDLGFWQGSVVVGVNVSSTPITITSYRDIIGDAWDYTGWSKRILVQVQPSGVVGDLYNFPVYVDLADLGDDFFASVDAAGDDIVVTTGGGGLKLERELVDIDTGAKTGELHFRAPFLAANVSTDFYIYFGNASAAETNDQSLWSDYTLIQHLNEDPSGSAPQMIDSSQSSNDGTSVGTMTTGDLVDAKVGTGLDFDGSDDSVSLDSFNNLTSAQGTISFWLNFNTLQNCTIFHFYELSTSDYIRSYYLTTGPYIDLIVEDENVVKVNLRYMSPDTTGWHRLDYVQDGSSVKIYFDGQQPSLTEITQSGDWWTDHLTLDTALIGDGAWGNTAAIMDEFRVSDQAFSAEWIETSYNNQNSSNTFYSTSTVETLSDAVVCNGTDLFGYCWYQASAASMSCDQVCAENALTCVSGVSFSDASCSLNVALGSYSPGTCSVGCFDQDLTYSPGNYTSADVCLTSSVSPAYTCGTTETSGVYKIICACE